MNDAKLVNCFHRTEDASGLTEQRTYAVLFVDLCLQKFQQRVGLLVETDDANRHCGLITVAVV